MKVVYETKTGRAISIGSRVADTLPDGLSVADVGDVNWRTHRWDEATKAIVVREAETTPLIPRARFLRRIPKAVRIAIEEMLDDTTSTAQAKRRRARVRDFLRLISDEYVDVTDADVVEYVGDMVTASLMTQQEADAVLALEVVE